MKKLILFLVRKRLGLKEYQLFQFTNQKDKTVYYYFEPERIVKKYPRGVIYPSSVSLNWLLDDECEIERF